MQCLASGFRGGPIFPAVFLGIGLATLPVVWFDVSPTLAVAVGAAAGMAAQSRLILTSMLFAALGHSPASTTSRAAPSEAKVSYTVTASTVLHAKPSGGGTRKLGVCEERGFPSAFQRGTVPACTTPPPSCGSTALLTRSVLLSQGLAVGPLLTWK